MSGFSYKMNGSNVTIQNSSSDNPIIVDNLPYDSSLFGGIRAHSDLQIFERLHDYPGSGSAYDTDAYGFESGSSDGTITHIANYGTLRLALTGTTVNQKARLRSHDVVRYQPGCMPVIQLTGFASDNTGWTLKFIRRTSTSGTPVDNVESTITGYDASKANRYEIRFAYLGVQTARGYINGSLESDSTFAGVLSVPYMKSPHLPISTEIQTLASGSQVIRTGIFDDNDGLFFEWSRLSASAAPFYYDYKCSSARLVGGSDYPYQSYGATYSTTNVSDTARPLFSIKASDLLNGITSSAQVFPRLVSFFSETQPGALSLVYNPTLTSASWAATSPSPGVNIDTAATAYSGGTVLWRVGQGANQQYTYDLNGIFNLVGRKLRHQAFTRTPEILTFVVQREGPVNFDPRVSLVWDELR